MAFPTTAVVDLFFLLLLLSPFSPVFASPPLLLEWPCDTPTFALLLFQGPSESCRNVFYDLARSNCESSDEKALGNGENDFSFSLDSNVCSPLAVLEEERDQPSLSKILSSRCRPVLHLSLSRAHCDAKTHRYIRLVRHRVAGLPIGHARARGSRKKKEEKKDLWPVAPSHHTCFFFFLASYRGRRWQKTSEQKNSP